MATDTESILGSGIASEYLVRLSWSVNKYRLPLFVTVKVLSNSMEKFSAPFMTTCGRFVEFFNDEGSPVWRWSYYFTSTNEMLTVLMSKESIRCLRETIEDSRWT